MYMAVFLNLNSIFKQRRQPKHSLLHFMVCENICMCKDVKFFNGFSYLKYCKVFLYLDVLELVFRFITSL